MFGKSSPWLTMIVRTIRNQMATLSKDALVWQHTAGIVDMWQEGNIEVSTADGDWQVTSQKQCALMNCIEVSTEKLIKYKKQKVFSKS